MGDQGDVADSPQAEGRQHVSASTEDPRRSPDGATAPHDPAAYDADTAGGADLLTDFVHNTVRDHVRGRTILQGANIYIGRFDAGDHHTRESRERLHLTADLTASAESVASYFVEPERFPELVHHLAAAAFVIVTGAPGTGRRTAILQALRKSGCERVVQIAVEDDLRHVAAAVRDGEGGVGYVLDGLESTLLSGLRDVVLHQMRDCAAPGERAIALVVDSVQETAIPRLDDVAIVQLDAPDPRTVLRRRLEADDRAGDIAALTAVVERFPAPVQPRHVIELVDSIPAGENVDPEHVAAAYSNVASFEALDEWLGSGRPSRDVALVAAAATLHHLPLGDVYLGAQDLRGRLPVPPGDEGTADAGLIRRADNQWPTAIIQLADRVVPTHFGSQPMRAVAFHGHHRPEWVMKFLWDRLGPDFRNPFVQWLSDLPDRPGMAEPAAITAGVLFADDPVSVERHVLRSWATSETRRRNRAAAIAVGLPSIMGSDSAGARALVRHWSRSDNTAMTRTAVLAYGSVLGAFDDLAQGAVHLQRIRSERPELRLIANWALANLVAAGGEAGRARAEVMAVLASDERRSTDMPRYDVLPAIATCLVARQLVARESLAALFGDAEAPTLAAFARLLSDCLLSGESDYGDEVLEVFVRAAATAAIDEERVTRLLEVLRDEGRRGSGLGPRVERSLSVLARRAAQAIRDDKAIRINRGVVEVLSRLDEAFFTGGDQ